MLLLGSQILEKKSAMVSEFQLLPEESGRNLKIFFLDFYYYEVEKQKWSERAKE